MPLYAQLKTKVWRLFYYLYNISLYFRKPLNFASETNVLQKHKFLMILFFHEKEYDLYDKKVN